MDGAVRHNGHRATTSRTRTLSGSEAIRNRVAHLMQNTKSSTTHPYDGVHIQRSPSPRSSLSSSREARPMLVPKDKPLPISTIPMQSRVLGEKPLSHVGSSDRHENRYSKSLGTSSTQQHNARVFDATARLPQLDHDLNIPPSHRRGTVGSSKRPSHDVHDKGRLDVFRGSLAVAEYDRMKQEVESLKEALQDSRKTSKRCLKKLEEAKAELNAALFAAKGAQSELQGLKDLKERHKKNEELISSIESSIQCQICMDLPDKPFVLSPCGHILCLSCLQEWFRKAPPTMDDVDIDEDELTDPHYILMRSKSCPTCRAVVKRRPVPVFMVKAVVSALQKAKATTVPTTGLSTLAAGEDYSSQTNTEDPWKGIFPSSDDPSEDADSAEEYGFFSDLDDNEVPQAVLELFHRQQSAMFGGSSMFSAFDLSSDSEVEESEDEDGLDYESDEELVPPRWAPPRAQIRPHDLHLTLRADSQETLKLLRRGCNLGMIQNFDVTYSHRSGIIVSLHSLDQLYGSESDYDSSDDRYSTTMNRVYLGWNISLQAHDTDGELYLAGVLEDIKNNPSEWMVTPRPGVRGARDAKRLIRLDEVEAYDTTDSEIWIDTEEL